MSRDGLEPDDRDAFDRWAQFQRERNISQRAGSAMVLKGTDVDVADFTAYTTALCIDLDIGGWGGTPEPTIKKASMLVDYVWVTRV